MNECTGKEFCEGTEYCGDDKCQTCCPHDEFDHYICLDCGYEKCPGGDIDAAEYIFDPER